MPNSQSKADGIRSVFHPPLVAPNALEAYWSSLPGASLALALVAAARKHQGPMLVVCDDSAAAQILENDLAVFADAAVPVHLFPDWETLPYDLFSPHPDIVSERLATLYQLQTLKRGILIVAVPTLLQRLPPRSYVYGGALQLKLGQSLVIEAERLRLEAAGYRCVPQVTEHGEFAVRGALLDLYPMGSQTPFRVELFDDEIESIRTFDPDTQLSIEKVNSVELLQGREYPFDDDGIETFRANFRQRFDVDLRNCTVYQDVKNGIGGGGIEYYLPLFFDHTETLFDYLPKASWIARSTTSSDAIEAFLAQVGERFESRRHDVQRPLLRSDELYLTADGLTRRAQIFATLWLNDDAQSTNTAFDAEPAPSIELSANTEQEFASMLAFVEQFGGRTLLTVDSPGRREVVADQLAALGERPQTINDWAQFQSQRMEFAIASLPLSDGFLLPQDGIAVISEAQLFGHRTVLTGRERRAGRDPASIIRDLTDLRPGAPVVHEDYGVGRYLGLTRLDAGDIDAEFLALEYADGDKVYVPVASLELISRYTGASPDNAPLHKLGSEQWTKAKRKAAQKAHDVAAELLDLHARRAARQGTAMAIDPSLYQQFCAGFPFQETTDQLNAISDVLGDLQSELPMDRVVCGDVGFGKTEVALRAAFVAVQAGKQVALLVPTTLLAQQHYQNFLDRFADWPVRIEALSRFQSKKAIDQALAAAAEGKVDILIGTHRLLQKDVKVANLGLVIIDEEQRFGVRHKERLKALRAEVDLLTLTATPIPRTLNMSLSGIRDLSIIATAPVSRMSVRTFVQQWDPTWLRDAVQRELQRGGQVYFLHNEVQTINRQAEQLAELFPQARIAIAHGQMRERALEQVMLDFHQQRFNILVCSTIIESGIDIPSANTIIINRADKFGLAQLHQLRGRVGRSHHRAFAYLVVPPAKSMTADARKRIEAIESLRELGSGFTLATHDLEIRGAGELLGEGQSGQIAEIGFALYTELLERAVTALKSGRQPELDAPLERGVEVDLGIPALIPDDYLPDVHTRLVIYKRIASARDSKALERLQVEMIDRFGLLPEPVKHLFAIAEIKQRVTPLGIREIVVGSAGGRIKFTEKPQIDPLKIIQLVQRQPRIFSFQGQEVVRFKFQLDDAQARISKVNELIGQLAVKDAA